MDEVENQRPESSYQRREMCGLPRKGGTMKGWRKGRTIIPITTFSEDCHSAPFERQTQIHRLRARKNPETHGTKLSITSDWAQFCLRLVFEIQTRSLEIQMSPLLPAIYKPTQTPDLLKYLQATLYQNLGIPNPSPNVPGFQVRKILTAESRHRWTRPNKGNF
jgi:hypothetical protein